MTSHNAPPPGSEGREPDGAPGDLRRLDRRILALAVPSLGALVAEPTFILADSAIVGRLGTAPLAGLTIASTLLMTVVGLCIFLAYATTATVARLVGQGDRARALAAGVDGAWLAAGLGLALAAAIWASAPWAAAALGAEGEVLVHATSYLRWSAPGLPGMLVVLAATGALRGVEDTRTPLVVAATGAVVNVGLNVAFVYGAGMGIAGSGLGTAMSQTGMGVALAVVLARGARRHGVGLRPTTTGVLAGARTGTPLFVRTLSLRLAILLTVGVAAQLGDVNLAAHQVVASVWGFTALVLDALAIAAQVIVGQAVGQRSVVLARSFLRRSIRWGLLVGVVLGVVVGASSWWISAAFTTETPVRTAITAGLVVAAVFMPLGGCVFLLDGVLIGAGDGRYLAVVGMLTLAVYAPVAFAVAAWAPPGAAGLAWLWVAFAGVFMAARAATTAWRVRTDVWMTAVA